MRETDRSLSTMCVWILREAVPSKELLLYGETRNDNSANNGETLFFEDIFQSVLENFMRNSIKVIPWEVLNDPVTTDSM